MLDDLNDALRNYLAYQSGNGTYSPFFSDIGLAFDGRPGIATIYTHYNRKCNAIGVSRLYKQEPTDIPFLTVAGELHEQQNSIMGVSQRVDQGKLHVAFYAINSWVVEYTGPNPLTICWGIHTRVEESYLGASQPDIVLLHGYMQNMDQRDPDSHFPIALGIQVVNGRLVGGNGPLEPLVVAPDDSQRVIMRFSMQLLDIDVDLLASRLHNGPPTAADAEAAVRKWWEEALSNCDLPFRGDKDSSILARAAYTLISNSTQAPGLLAGRVASFPSRGRYPAHYLWDSCFHTLGLELLNTKLAEDALLLLVENLRADGKMPQFICSTWVRPLESQPPLVGWFALRLVKQRNDLELAEKILPGLVRNSKWWLTQRMTRYGLIGISRGVETGWDNSPRFDQGTILACDINSYLVMQLRTGAEMSRMIGDQETGAWCEAAADRLAARMVELLYNPQQNTFNEILAATGEPIAVRTPANFLPLLAGVPLAETAIRNMIEHDLLNPNTFYGQYPFPCVAYDQPQYQPERWWRGPVWLPVAWFMLEILRLYGYSEARHTALRRLYDMVVADGKISELFNSQTGEGLGADQQGWTAAIFISMFAELKLRKQGEN